ncbi:MAG: SH3 domain-containing protein [Pyrinomonadaceae bacterium]|nr:SH3 domain-containing protein [Pyrinomonadaceae bacterium]
MKTKIYYLVILIFVALAGAGATQTAAQTQVALPCKVSDGTGTALNVRSKPNGGKIVKKLKNGTKVFIWEETGDAQDRGWSLIRLTPKGKNLGWVLFELLECE